MRREVKAFWIEWTSVMDENKVNGSVSWMKCALLCECNFDSYLSRYTLKITIPFENEACEMSPIRENSFVKCDNFVFNNLLIILSKTHA